MMAVTKEAFIKEYTEAILKGNAAVFAGAGFSRPGYSSWKELLRPMALELNLDIEKEHDYLSIAQYFKNSYRGSSDISQTIMDEYTKNVDINEKARILTRLPIFTYWTTNYDDVIERGMEEANRNPDVKFEPDQLFLTKKDRNAIVYKMHGDAKIPTKAVLTKDDYDCYEKNYPFFRTLLSADLLLKTFLFIGFSFEDPNIDFILSKIHSSLNENKRKHYCFQSIGKKSKGKPSNAYNYEKKQKELKAENLMRYGIQTVFIDNYDEIPDILRRIEKRCKLKNVFISGSADKFSSPWEQADAEKLVKTIAGSLVKNDYRITSGFGLGIGSAVIQEALDVIYAEKSRHVDEYLCLRPFPQNISDPTERANTWRKYREDMLTETGVAIFLFGNKKDMVTGEIIEANGCIEEFEIAKAKGNIIIPIGSTGFAAKTILTRVKEDIDKFDYLRKYIDQLETTKDIDKISSLVMSIINDVRSR